MATRMSLRHLRRRNCPPRLCAWPDEYIRVKMKMFNDVVYNQFAHVNGSLPSR